jgi:hypothetical protein
VVSNTTAVAENSRHAHVMQQHRQRRFESLWLVLVPPQPASGGQLSGADTRPHKACWSGISRQKQVTS